MGTVSIVLHGAARGDGKYPLRIRVGQNRKYSYETQCYVKKGHFNEGASQLYSYEPDYLRLNKLIRKRYAEVVELVEFYDEKGWPYTSQDILAIDYPIWKSSQEKSKQIAQDSVPGGFIAFIREVVIPYWQTKKNLSNAEKYQLEADVFEEYLATLKPMRVDVPMADFNNALIEGYFSYLRTKKKPCKKDSTLKRRLAQIDAVLRFAHEKKGVISSIPNLEIDLNILKANKPKLTKDQIELLENYEWDLVNIPPKHQQKGIASLRRSVQTFLLQYYLFGARIGDVLLLTNSSVITQKGRPVRVEYYQQKGRKKAGKKLMSINVNPRLMAILTEYWNPEKPNDFLLPWMAGRYEHDFTISEEERAYNLKKAVHDATSLVNIRLKAACDWIGLDVPTLASHSARHSFAQRAKKKGKSIEWIKETLGHSTYDITAHYLADLDSEELNQNMADVYD
ncbi:tyrosine-type recombinase/integrase [Spirosoma fluviale]|uniref:Site-specific recombinase XerD n=1 Tax=Spirosoma fluviale TaxID=1597977 RepID=A0A286FCV5_9BACT|nr:tyrosine-type recombinase/integrase [Spirosoma fluviale]SOD80809.1 Site-specific recombinase XerD [Spirosoma fluviale]